MDYGAVPVACVDEHWLQQVFIPGAIMHLNSRVGLSLLPTDSPDEGSYLLGKIEQAFGDTREVHRISLDHRDPTVCFMSIWGSIDSRCFSQIDPDTILIRGGHYLPNWFLEEHLFALDKLCSAFHKTLVLTVGRLNNLRKLERSSIQTLSDVPRFSDYPQDTKRNFIQWAVAQYVDNLATDLLSPDIPFRDRLSELVAQKNPSSRDQILHFLMRLNDRVTSGDEVDFWSIASSISNENFTHFPTRLSTRDELCRTFEDCYKRLCDLRDPFSVATGYEFFRNNQKLPHAFDSGDPLNWLIGVVSFLANLFIDAGKRRGLSVIDKFRFDEERSDIVAVDGRSDFRDALHTLRTFFFHGIDPADFDECNKISKAAEFLAIAKPLPEDVRYSSRSALANLLDLLQRLVTDAEEVVNVLPKSPTGYIVRQTLEGAQREVEDFSLKECIRSVISELELELDPDLIFQRYSDSIRREIRETTCSLSQLSSALLQIVEAACFNESRRFPSIGKELMDIGLRGPELGFAQKTLLAEWESQPNMDLERLALRVREIAESIIATRRMS